MYFHIDMMVFPQRLVRLYADDVLDRAGKRISFLRNRTRQLLRAQFNEIFDRWHVDGLIVRTGET